MTPTSHTLTFYSISRPQVNALIDLLEKSGATVTEDTIAGKTPVGEVKANWYYVQGSGQLTVVVTEKPWEVSMNSVEHHIGTLLAQALVDSNKPVPEPAPAAKGEATAKPVSPAPAAKPAAAPVPPESPQTK